MRKRRIGVLVGAACIGVAVLTVGTAEAVPKATDVEECEEGAVVLHKGGSSAWAESGDAKYQLVALDLTVDGQTLDRKTGELVSFSDSFEKTWTSGRWDTFTCTSEHHESIPATGESFNIFVIATLRTVQ